MTLVPLFETSNFQSFCSYAHHQTRISSPGLPAAPTPPTHLTEDNLDQIFPKKSKASMDGVTTVKAELHHPLTSQPEPKVKKKVSIKIKKEDAKEIKKEVTSMNSLKRQNAESKDSYSSSMSASISSPSTIGSDVKRGEVQDHNPVIEKKEEIHEKKIIEGKHPSSSSLKNSTREETTKEETLPREETPPQLDSSTKVDSLVDNHRKVENPSKDESKPKRMTPSKIENSLKNVQRTDSIALRISRTFSSEDIESRFRAEEERILSHEVKPVKKSAPMSTISVTPSSLSFELNNNEPGNGKTDTSDEPMIDKTDGDTDDNDDIGDDECTYF